MVSALSPLTGLHGEDLNIDPVGQYYRGAQLQNQNTMQQQQISQADYEKHMQQLSVINRLATHAKSLPLEQRQAFAQSLNKGMLSSIGVDADQLAQGPFDDQTLDSLIAQTGSAIKEHGPIGQAASFNEMTKGLSESEREDARRIALGLSPRAQGSAAITIANQGLTEKVGASEASMAGQKKGAENAADIRDKPIIAGNVARAEAGVEAATKPGIARDVTTATEKAKIDAINRQSEAVASGKLDDATALYNDLSKADLDKVYGRGESKFPDWARSQEGVDMIAKRNQLIAMLKLGARGELKGQGAVSDSESAMVADAATLLNNPDISPALAKEALDRAMNVLRRNAGKSEGGSGKGTSTPGITPTKSGSKLTYDPTTGTFK